MTHVQRPMMRLSKMHEWWVYAICASLFFSGVGWLVAHYFFASPSSFGESVAPSEPWWLRVHGAAAMAALVMLGTLFPGHIARAWAFRQNIASGVMMLAATSVLILTGYGLYYAGGEELRPWISLIHWIVGLAAGAALILHIRLGKRRRVRAAPPSPDAHGAGIKRRLFRTFAADGSKGPSPTKGRNSTKKPISSAEPIGKWH